jgi:predicted small metal-binding protein
MSEETENNRVQKAVSNRDIADAFQYSVCQQITDDEIKENDFSSLTAQEIIEKVRDHLKQEPTNVNSLVFLRYLAYFPVSLCKREVSPLLKKLIGFHYNLGAPDEHLRDEHGVTQISYDDLAQIFVRSKATISQYVDRFKDEWLSFQSDLAKSKEIEEEARRQLVEEQKEKIRITNEETPE